MSSRALRRLQEQKQEVKNDDDDLEEDDILPPISFVKKKNIKGAKTGNIFELLTVEEDENQIKADEENDFEEKEELPTVTSKRKKKRNKKKAKDPLITVEPADDELDEIDQTINQINALYGVTVASNDSSKETCSDPSTVIFTNKSVFTVDPRNLNPINEMKRRFGPGVVNDNRRRDPHSRRPKRTTSLVTPKDNWPPFKKVGIAMNLVKTENSCSHFAFEHQEIYRAVQFKFYDAVESMNHNNIVTLVNTHPYHIDSMLQLSEICRINEDYQMAGELIERSLYVFECAFHTLFNITQSNCRLDYRRAENRPFFLALYRRITYIGDKACYRTSLELCKVLFGLSPAEDPLGVLLMIDYYALKAEEYRYFEQLYDEFEISRNMALLPNFTFSYALAKFHTGSCKEADKFLRKSLITFPSFLVQLADKCGIDIDNTIKSHPYFNPISYLKQSAPLNQLIALYVGRCFSLWKAAKVMDWLVGNAKYIIDNLEEYEDSIATAKNRWGTCFRFSPQNVLRHILISDIKEAMQCLPIEVRSLSVMTHDPLPPQDSIIGYERPLRANSAQQDVNMLSLFLRSLMPSYNQAAVDQPEPQQGNELQDQARALNDENNEGSVGNVVDGARRLMDVMRDLLNTMTYRNDEAAHNADGEDHNEIDDQDWEE